MMQLALDVLLWLLASPIIVVLWGVRLSRRIRFWKTAYTVQVACGHCGTAISLVGLWKCGCGHTYAGHLLRVCPICHSLPRVVRCFSCGVTRLLPRDV